MTTMMTTKMTTIMTAKIMRLCCTLGFLLSYSTSLRIVEHPEDTFVHRNDPATLNCRAEGEQNPLITWYRNGEKIEKSSAYKILRSNGQLYFPSVNYLHHFFASSNNNNKLSKAAPDTGVYYCNATDPKSGMSIISRNATLQLKDLMLEEFKDASILSTETPLGEPVALQCKLQHTDHHSDVSQGENGVTWMKDGTVVEGRDRVKVEWNGTLYIEEVKKEDAGFYTCLIFSSTGPKESRPVRLMVLEKPHIKEGPVGVKVELGGDAMFHCRATGDPEPIMSWRRKGGHLPQNRSKVLGSQSLLLSNVQVDDEGEYVCVVENTVGRDEKSAKLVVHVLPSFVLTPKSKSVNLGRRVTLECQAEGSPTPEVFWTKENDKLHMLSDRKYGRMSVAKFGSLTIEKVQKEDGGVYLCHAESLAGKTVVKTRLEVKEVTFVNTRLPPIILLGFQDQILPLKTTAVLLCNVTGDPPPVVSWFKNGKLLLLFEPKFKMLDDGTLMITALDSGDAGMYTCKASSETGEASWSARLRVEPHTDTSIIFKRTPEPHTYPGPPIKLHASEIKDSSIRLSWKPNPDSGYSQVTSFAVEYFSHESGEGWTRVSENVKETFFTVRNLLPGTAYMFLVRAQNSHGISFPSQVAIVKTKGSGNSETNFQQTEESQNFISSTPHRFQLSSHHAVHMVIVKLHQPPSSDVGSTHVRIRWDVRSPVNSQQLSRHVEGFHIRYCVLPDLKLERKQGPGLDSSQFATQTVNDPHARSYYVHGLEENTRYMFYIQPYHNSTAKPASNKIFVKTKEDVPSAPPTNIQATVLENNTLKLTWMPPPKSHQNGPLVGYKVYVSANDSHVQKDVWLNSTAEMAYIHNLNTANTYQIQISAYSNAGEGQVSEPIVLGFRDNAAKMKMSHGTSRETSWWVILVCVLAAVLTAFIFLSLLLMLKKQRRKDMDKETHYFTSGELGASIAQSTTAEKDVKKPITPVFESTYENLSSVYSAQSTHGSTIDSKPSPAANGTGKFGKVACAPVFPQAIHRYTQQHTGPTLLGNNAEQLICQTYMIKPKLMQDQTLKSDGYKGVYEGINTQLSESFLPTYEEDNTMSQLLAMRKMSLNCQQMSNYFKPIESSRGQEPQSSRPFYTISNRASRHSRRPTSSDMEDSEVFKAEVERRFLSGGRDLFSDLCSS